MSDGWVDAKVDLPPDDSGAYVVIGRPLCGCDLAKRVVVLALRTDGEWQLSADHPVEVTHWWAVPELPFPNRRADA